MANHQPLLRRPRRTQLTSAALKFATRHSSIKATLSAISGPTRVVPEPTIVLPRDVPEEASRASGGRISSKIMCAGSIQKSNLSAVGNVILPLDAQFTKLPATETLRSRSSMKLGCEVRDTSHGPQARDGSTGCLLQRWQWPDLHHSATTHRGSRRENMH